MGCRLELLAFLVAFPWWKNRYSLPVWTGHDIRGSEDSPVSAPGSRAGTSSTVRRRFDAGHAMAVMQSGCTSRPSSSQG